MSDKPSDKPSKKPNDKPVQFGITGVSGYAKTVTDTLRKHGPATDPPIHLAAVCDPWLDRHTERVAELAAEGVTAHPSLDAMLGTSADAPTLDAVWLPLPIALHRPLTEQALAAGKAVLCEKPAAGTVQDVDAMIAARDRANLPALIGFQHIYIPETAELKRRLLDGAIGRIRRATVHGYWPRSTNYFARTDWAGCLRHRGQWVLDSPIQNAMSHYVNLPLFLLGSAFEASAAPARIEAELYRAAPIENYDTISARVQLDGDVSMLVLLTHAAAKRGGPFITIEGDKGKASWHPGEGPVIETASGRASLTHQSDNRFHMLQSFARTVRGESIAPLAVATLETARAHTVVVNGASQAAPVRDVPHAAIEKVTGDQPDEVFHAIRGIEDVFDRCAREHLTLHEAKALNFTAVPAACDLRDYRAFTGPHPETGPPAASSAAATK